MISYFEGQFGMSSVLAPDKILWTYGTVMPGRYFLKSPFSMKLIYDANARSILFEFYWILALLQLTVNRILAIEMMILNDSLWNNYWYEKYN